MRNVIILGFSAFYHDSAACLVKNGEIIAAVQEERFTRKKHDSSFPHNAILYCLEEAGISAAQINHVVFYEKPFLKFERLLETYLAFAPRGFKSFAKAMPIWVKDKLFQKSLIIKELRGLLGTKIDWKERLLFSEHHLSHAASAFFPSPFGRAAVLTMDGVGEWATTSLALGEGKNLEIIKEIHFPHSLGLLYSAFTYYLGFKVNSGEYKIMGLAPYGVPRYANLIKENLIHISDDGSFRLDMSYFSFATGLTMTNEKFESLFESPPRKPETDLSQREMDLAASVQQVLEEVVLSLARNVHSLTGERNLCLAGGVALNCVANGALLREKVFDNIWIQPASGDSGCAIGAALAVWHLHYKMDRKKSFQFDSMRGAYLGPEYSNSQVKEELVSCEAKFHEMDDSRLIEEVAGAIATGKTIGWMCGRMEFGPRALGARSIIADPRSKSMQKQLNLKVKYRESFRPFAPSVLKEDVSQWFDLNVSSPYMLLTATVKTNKRRKLSKKQKALFGIELLNVPKSTIPAVTHVDYSSRIQTVHKNTNPKFHALISKFKEKTGCPILVNTSFNVRGEPIVCTPTDAFNCFMGTDLDMLVIENFILFKNEQGRELRKSYIQHYELD